MRRPEAVMFGHYLILVVHQIPGVGDLRAGDGTHLRSGYGDDCSRLAGESDELDFVSHMVWINMDDRSNVAGLKALPGKRGRQDYPVMFVDHCGNLLKWVGCDKPWSVGASVDDPDRSDGRTAAIRTKD